MAYRDIGAEFRREIERYAEAAEISQRR